jgi:ABC-2 type transport system ATP-binding protein
VSTQATPAVDVRDLRHAYGGRLALDGVSLSVAPGEIFGLLGPNGSGKTTLFRILSTLIPTSPGRATILGLDVAADRDAVRRRIGVVFQSPSLDKQLTAEENLVHQGHLYGLRGAALAGRVRAALASVGLGERARERVGTFSGGMRRRVEVAKGLLHRPPVLLMDEPSTGIDPAARIELWRQLRAISGGNGTGRDGTGGHADGGNVTVLLTTHLMEEAEHCTRLAIMAGGRLLACDTPAALKSRIGGDVLTVTTREPDALRAAIAERLGVQGQVIGNTVRLERERGHEFVPQVVQAAPAGLVDSISVGKPTLEDVFVRLTGERFAASAQDDRAAGTVPVAR